jgi:hypothetical protein
MVFIEKTKARHIFYWQIHVLLYSRRRILDIKLQDFCSRRVIDALFSVYILMVEGGAILAKRNKRNKYQALVSG